VPRVYFEVGASEWEEGGVKLFHEPLRFQAIRKLFREEGDVVQYSVHSFVTPLSSFSKSLSVCVCVCVCVCVLPSIFTIFSNYGADFFAPLSHLEALEKRGARPSSQ
jgi:hypothetical protein